MKDKILQRLVDVIEGAAILTACAALLTIKWTLDAYGWGGVIFINVVSWAIACFGDWFLAEFRLDRW